MLFNYFQLHGVHCYVAFITTCGLFFFCFCFLVLSTFFSPSIHYTVRHWCCTAYYVCVDVGNTQKILRGSLPLVLVIDWVDTIVQASVYLSVLLSVCLFYCLSDAYAYICLFSNYRSQCLSYFTSKFNPFTNEFVPIQLFLRNERLYATKESLKII